MSLQNIFNEVSQSFDPKKDKINAGGFQKLPSGEYNVSIEVGTFTSEKSGFIALGVNCKVVDGEEAGREENVFINLSETKKDGTPMPEFVVAKYIKMLMTLADLCGVVITQDMMVGNLGIVYQNLTTAFIPSKGKIIKMIKEIKDYTDENTGEQKQSEEYEFEESTLQFNNVQNPQTISDEDLPF